MNEEQQFYKDSILEMLSAIHNVDGLEVYIHLSKYLPMMWRTDHEGGTYQENKRDS